MSFSVAHDENRNFCFEPVVDFMIHLHFKIKLVQSKTSLLFTQKKL